MRKDICFVCIGQCAGNIGSLLEQRGYDTLFINTAATDLALLKKAKHVYKIPGECGCNQDPEKAQSIFAQHSESILNKIKQFATKRIVYFVSSSSGGTSGMTPLVHDMFLTHLAELENKEWETYYDAIDSGKSAATPIKRKAGLITVLPSLAESAVLNRNSYDYMRQHSETLDREIENENTNLANTFLLDNENCADVLRLNHDFVDLFDEILKIPERHKSLRGNVDPADLEKGITAPGITVLGRVSKDKFSISSLVNALTASSIFSQVEERTGRYWVSSTTEEIDTLDLEKELGSPETHYKTYNDSTNLFAWSGLGIPVTRINLIADRAEEYNNTPMQRNSAAFSRELKTVKPRLQPKAAPTATKERVKGQTNTPEEPAAAVSIEDKLQMLRRRRR